MLVILTAAVCFIFTSGSGAFILTERRPLNPDGRDPSLGILQGYDPVSADQQGGSPNFQQPNVLTGQKVQIQTATSRPVFGMFGQQQPTQCSPTPPNMQIPSGASQELFDYYNQLHATRQPFANPQQQQYWPWMNYGQQVGNDYNNHNNKNNNNQPENPIPQVTGTAGPLSVFSRADHVPLSMQLTSQQGRPIYITNNQESRPVNVGKPQLGSLYGNQNGNQAPPGGPSTGPANQKEEHNTRTTTRPQNGPIGYQPINIGKRIVREKRATNSLFSQANMPKAIRSPTGYQGSGQSPTDNDNNNDNSNNNNGYMGAPYYFTDPFVYQMDQNSNPLPHRMAGSQQEGVMAFSDPSIFLGGSRVGEETATHSANVGTQTGGPASTWSKHNTKNDAVATQTKHKETAVGVGGGDQAVSSSGLNQVEHRGGVQENGEDVHQNGMMYTPALSSKESFGTDDAQDSLILEVETFDPNKVNLSPFNFFDPRSMMSANGRGKRRSFRRREAEFDPTKMNAGTFEPSKMAAGRYNPSSVNGLNGATSQNPSSHPVGHFDPSSMLAGHFNPGKGDAGETNPGSMQQKSPKTQTPSGQTGISVGAQTGAGIPTGAGTQTGSQTGPGSQTVAGTQTGAVSGSNNQPTQGQGYDPDHIPSGSSFVPGSGGQFDPSEWSDFIGKK